MSLLVLEPDNQIRYRNIYVQVLEKKKKSFPFGLNNEYIMNTFCLYFKIQLPTFFLRNKLTLFLKTFKNNCEHTH